MSSSATVHGGQALGALLRSSKMHKVPSLVFDMEIEEGIKSVRSDECEGGDVGDVAQQVTASVRPRATADRQLRSDVDAILQEAGDAGCDAPQLALVLSALGYRALVRTALGGGYGNACLMNLRHTFLICVAPGAPARNATRYVVDPGFREAFEVARPTQRYAAALAAVPPVFVGTEETLTALVTLLCSEMLDSFAARGAVLPPWRKAESMLSKWLPRRSVDASVSSGGGLVSTTPPAAADWRCLVSAIVAGASPSSGGAWFSDASAGRQGLSQGGLSARLCPQRRTCQDASFTMGRDLAAVALQG